jgi:hypothetical protein
MRTAVLLGMLAFSQLLLAQGEQDPANYSVSSATVGNIGTLYPPAHDSLRLSQAQMEPVKAAATRTSWRGFWAMTAAATALTFADVELSQTCLQQGTCAEVNPLLPRSRGAAYAIQLPLTATGVWFSYRMKKHRRKYWSPQLGLVVGHAIGSASGVRAAY